MKWNAFGSVSAFTAAFVLIWPGVALGRSQEAKPSSTNPVAKDVNSSGACTPGIKDNEDNLSYLIGSGDVLTVTVWKDAELTRTMPVRPDGMISMPMLGEFQASGLTASQLQLQLCEKLAEYILTPQVNVTVSEIKSRTFNVVGRVSKAGSFELVKPTTVLDAIAAAGGFQEFARLTKIYVLRRDVASQARVLPFNYKQVIKGRRIEENVQLHPGDTVVVP